MRGHKPLVSDADQRVDTVVLDIDRQHPQRLTDVDHEQGIAGMREAGNGLQIVAIAAFEFHMADGHCPGARSNGGFDPIQVVARLTVVLHESY
jgi:hypothetical protein